MYGILVHLDGASRFFGKISVLDVLRTYDQVFEMDIQKMECLSATYHVKTTNEYGLISLNTLSLYGQDKETLESVLEYLKPTCEITFEDIEAAIDHYAKQLLEIDPDTKQVEGGGTTFTLATTPIAVKRASLAMRLQQ